MKYGYIITPTPEGNFIVDGKKGNRIVERITCVSNYSHATSAGARWASKKNPQTNKNKVVWFGKYKDKNKSFGWIIENDPSYILWLDREEVLDLPEEWVEEAEINDANNNPPEEYFWQPD